MTLPESPLISIMIPTYNRASMVSKAIESALAQTYRSIEVVVVDNASEDGIENVIAQYCDSRLKFVKNSSNLGQFGNFNRCIELAKGKYIHILHSDDFIDPTFTEKCVQFLEAHPEVAMSFSSEQVLSDGEKSKSVFADHDQIFRAPEGFRQILLRGNFIPCPSVMVKRDIFKNIGKFSLEYPFAADYYQWLKISKKFDIAFVANTTLFYRQGEHTESFHLLEKTPLGYFDNIKIYFRIIEELGDDIASYHYELNIAIRRHMYKYINTGIWHSNLMKSYSPLIFIGFALNFWTLIRPYSFVDRIKKFFDAIYLLTVWFSLVLPGGRSCLKMVLLLKREIIKRFVIHLKSKI